MPAHRSSSSPEVIVHIDGASRGNPGPAAYGVVVEANDGAPLAALSKFLGNATNNFAEYQALLAALDYVIGHAHRRVKVLSDSELLVRQMVGQYKVKSADLKPLHERASRAAAQLEAFSIVHVPRERNREADRLANQALDSSEVGAGFKPAPTLSPQANPMRARATFTRGILKPHQDLPLVEGAEVDLEIRPKK